jgi:hypothetical protein
MELKSFRQSLVDQLLSFDDMATLKRLQKYLNRLRREQEEEVMTKEELIAGIDAGLKEVKLAMEGKIKLKDARELLDEL